MVKSVAFVMLKVLSQAFSITTYLVRWLFGSKWSIRQSIYK